MKNEGDDKGIGIESDWLDEWMSESEEMQIEGEGGNHTANYIWKRWQKTDH